MLRRTGSNILYLGCPEECGSETKEGRGCVEQVQIYCTWAVLLHNGGFFNNCNPKRCLHISVHFKTDAL